MRIELLRQRLLATTIICGAFVAAPAFAQTPVPAPGQSASDATPGGNDTTNQEVPMSAVPTGDASPSAGDDDDGLIIVTGSRIARRDLSSSSPLAVVNDEEFKLSGAVNVEQVINTLPQVVPGTTGFSNNPGGGVSTLNLRGLGSVRTLVLVNGRRYASFDTQQLVDLNTIPQFLIDGVDVYTGGASAVYGSDALAGVVNFRLRNDLEGVLVGGQYSITGRGDGEDFNAYMAIGTEIAGGRGHVTVFGEYFNRKAIFQGARGFSRVTQGEDEDENGNPILSPVGSATTERGRITAAATATVPAAGGLAAVTLPVGAGTNFGTPFGANFAQPGVSARFNFPADTYNFAPANYLQVPQERWMLGGYGEYEITEGLSAYTEVVFINNRVDNELAPTPVTGATNVGLAGNQANLSAADFAALQQIDANETIVDATRVARGLAPQFSALGAGPGVVRLGVNRRVVETGSREALDERNAFRVLAGVKGDITDQFSFDAYYFYSRTRNAQIQNGNVSRSAFNAGVLDGSVNVFGPGTISGAGVDAITILSQNQDISELQVATASVSGNDLFNLGMGAEGVGVAAGVEYRAVDSRFIPDTALSSGDVVGFNAGEPTEGGYNVTEFFGELRIPLIADQPFFHRLEVNGAARYANYSLGGVGNVFTWAAGAQWAPIPDITFRGGYQVATRAPNVGELFGGQANGFPGATDPCSSRNPAGNRTEALRQLCIATGVPAASVFTTGIQPNAQIEGIFGGNPDLGEESSDSYTVGAIIRPSFIPRLNITVDYFNITIKDLVSVFGGGLDNALNLCYNEFQDPNSIFCQAFPRDSDGIILTGPASPRITNANIASLFTDGIDLAVDYNFPLPFSLLTDTGEQRVQFSFLGTWTRSNELTPVVGLDDTEECSGYYGNTCGEVQAEYKFSARLSFIDGPLTSSVRVRYLSSAFDDQLNSPGVDRSTFAVLETGDETYLDLAFSIDVRENLSLAIGVNNVLDNEPTVLGGSAEQANTFPDTYDVLGRDFFVSARATF